MRERKTEAIILHTTDIFDADRSYLIFTREFGKIRARGKGVRRPGSRLSGHLLSYIPTVLEVVESGGGWHLITQAQASGEVREYPSDSLHFLQYAELIAEVVDAMLPDREPHPDLFEGIIYTLNRLQEICTEADPDEGLLLLVTAEFLFKMLIVLGYQPQLQHCVVTDTPLQEEGLGWSSVLGGVVNKDGLAKTPLPALRLQFPRTIVVLRQLARPEFVAERLGMDAAMRDEASRVIFDYLQTQIGKPLKSYTFLARLS